MKARKDSEGFDCKKDTEAKSRGNRTQYLTKSGHLQPPRHVALTRDQLTQPM